MRRSRAQSPFFETEEEPSDDDLLFDLSQYLHDPPSPLELYLNEPLPSLFSLEKSQKSTLPVMQENRFFPSTNHSPLHRTTNTPPEEITKEKREAEIQARILAVYEQMRVASQTVSR